ncbi:ABC transporter permease [Roseobacter denitrificans]|uniref:ABC transporter, permease protein, putative n=1 Tax=Roseobacter denitrificans (strain ATCC 33942 / OCh 114) TaxID=375451 RepID=Q167C5_ROSDO|nr:ABC transporter permease subunit [Roseobacter denitrificans]ABG31918.1 ABC transporter, permease protein, putative [Roseobacter denitrificans OCh 114]AVL51461.1 ABC transporter permease [Roseobacter denitrificans]SFG48258.1 ABC-type nitrate/sulfonate/bicarbonate transport system, permease component [Roseobacter denitrificans OCh 114]
MSIRRGTIAAVVLLGLWEGAAQVLSDGVLFVGPLGILFHIGANPGLLVRATATTTQNAALGFLWGNLAAVLMASVVVVLPRTERVISSAALVVFCLPLVATGPILRVISGPGDTPQIALAALAVYYTTFLAMRVGLRAMPANWSDLMSVYGRGALATLLTVRARASLPYLFVGLQIAAPAAFLGAMIGEFTGAERGLGVLTLRAMRSLDVEATWSLAVISAAMAMLLYALVGAAGRWLVGYTPDIILSPPRTMAHNRWTGMLQACGAALLLILLWQISMDLADLNRFFAKRPADVLSYLLADAPARATLLRALAETTATTIPGYLAGLVLGAALAMGVILLPRASGVVLPVAVALRAIPIITTAPLIVLALGRGATGTIAVIAVMIFFPTFVACLQGLRQTPRAVSDLFRSYGAGPVTVLYLAQIPGMLPAFFAAAKMAVPAAILAVTTTEWLVTGKGIGLLVALTSTTSNYNMLWSCIVATTVLAVVIYAVVVRVERVVLSKYASEQVI